MGGDAGTRSSTYGITVGQYIEWLAAEAILPPNVPGHRELVPASLWGEYCFTYSNGDIRVGVRPPNHYGTLVLHLGNKVSLLSLATGLRESVASTGTASGRCP